MNAKKVLSDTNNKEYIYKKYLHFYDFSPLTLYIVEPPY